MSFLSQHGAVGTVALLRQGVAHSLKHHAMLCLTALVHCTTPELGMAASNAGAGDAIASAMTKWPHDTTLLGLALCAAFHTGLFDATEAILDATLACLERHGTTNQSLCQAGMRILRYHAMHFANMQMPRVATALATAMCKYRQDDTIQYYGAHAWISLLSVEPEEVVRNHGQTATFAINERVIQVAAGVTYHAVQVGEQPWHHYVLTQLFPRLRSAA